MGLAYSPWAFIQFSAVSAMARHPLSMVSEWPRLANAASNGGRPEARDVPCVIQPGRLLHGDGVAERIAELCCGKGPRSLPVRRIAQDREGGAQLRGREHQYARSEHTS